MPKKEKKKKDTETLDTLTIPIEAGTTIYCDPDLIVLAENFLRLKGEVPQWVFNAMFGSFVRNMQEDSSSGSTGSTA